MWIRNIDRRLWRETADQQSCICFSTLYRTCESEISLIRSPLRMGNNNEPIGEVTVLRIAETNFPCLYIEILK